MNRIKVNVVLVPNRDQVEDRPVLRTSKKLSVLIWLDAVQSKTPFCIRIVKREIADIVKTNFSYECRKRVITNRSWFFFLAWRLGWVRLFQRLDKHSLLCGRRPLVANFFSIKSQKRQMKNVHYACTSSPVAVCECECRLGIYNFVYDFMAIPIIIIDRTLSVLVALASANLHDSCSTQNAKKSNTLVVRCNERKNKLRDSFSRE